MIPKIIHYCWFGHNPLPESAIKCIESWKKFFPDYEIREWNEDNFNVDIIPYTKDAYEAKKYAFVSDYARFWILEKFGGLYFDTDVEVIKSMEDIIAEGAFLGAEIDGEKEKGEYPKVAQVCALERMLICPFTKRSSNAMTILIFGEKMGALINIR